MRMVVAEGPCLAKSAIPARRMRSFVRAELRRGLARVAVGIWDRLKNTGFRKYFTALGRTRPLGPDGR